MKITDKMITKMKELRESAFQSDYHKKVIGVPEGCDNITLLKAALELESELFMKYLAMDVINDIVCFNSNVITGKFVTEIANAIETESAE